MVGCGRAEVFATSQRAAVVLPVNMILREPACSWRGWGKLHGGERVGREAAERSDLAPDGCTRRAFAFHLRLFALSEHACG